MPVDERSTRDGGGRSDDDINVEVQWNTEYADSLVSAARRCYEYQDVLRNARQRDRDDPVEPGQSTREQRVRDAHRRFLRTTIGAHTLEFAILDDAALKKETP